MHILTVNLFSTRWLRQGALLLLACVIPLFSLPHFRITHVEKKELAQLDNNRLQYSLTVGIAPRVPDHYWSYYDERDSSIVIEFFGITMENRSGDFVPGRVFYRFGIEEFATQMSLTENGMRIRIGADPGWNLETATIDSTHLGLSVWRPLQKKRVREKRNLTWLLYIAIAGVVGTVTFLIIK